MRAEGLVGGVVETPMFVSYFVRGRPSYSQGRGFLGLHTMHADLHLTRSVLPNDEVETLPFILLTFRAFAGHVTLGGLCEHCIITDYEIGGFAYGDTRTYGIRFTLEIKVRHSGIDVE